MRRRLLVEESLLGRASVEGLFSRQWEEYIFPSVTMFLSEDYKPGLKLGKVTQFHVGYRGTNV